MSDVVPAVEEAFRLVAQGQSIAAPRLRLVHPALPEGSQGRGRPWERDLRIIPGAVAGIGFGVRLGGSLRRKAGGVMLALWDWETMRLLAVISDHLVHAVRSTAPDGVLAKYLALPEASTLGLIGSGRLARWAAEAVCAVRPIRQLRIWSPSPGHAEQCAIYLQSRADAGLQVDLASGAQDAVRDAQIVVTATTAAEPVLHGDWLAAGCTVICNRPEELDRDTIRRGRVVTTYRAGVLGHVPPYQALTELIEAGEVEANFTELGEVMTGRASGRSSTREIMVGLNPAFGVLDAAVARFVYDRAVQLGIGMELEP